MLFHKLLASLHFLPIFLLIVCCVLLSGCSGEQDKNQKGKQAKSSVVPVTSAVSTIKDMPISLEATGRAVATITVGIRSRINGTIESVHFKEGQEVKKGAVLFTIDRRPFQAVVKAKEAELAKNRAELTNAKKELDRYLPASKSGYVSEEKAEQAATKVASYTAAVQADEASLESARLDLEFCTLTAPITGIAGEILSDSGNLIKANSDTPLVTINQIAPISIAFDIPDKSLAEVRKSLAEHPLEVIARTTAKDAAPLTGTLSFIDNTINASTGNIVLKADFANTAGELWPGQLVAVSLYLRTQKDAVLVPSQAVQTGQDGAFVYVIRDDSTVEYRRVATGFRTKTETVVENGLAGNERVVTDGHLQLVDGGKVDDRSQKRDNETSTDSKRGGK